MKPDSKPDSVTHEDLSSHGKSVSSVRRSYEPPVLKQYGDLNAITKAVANNSVTLDGGTMSTQKTA